MSESSSLYECLEESWRELARDDLERGLDALRSALTKSPGNQALIDQIEHLEGGGDPKETLSWLTGSLEILRSPEEKEPDSLFDLFDEVSPEDIIAEGMISAAFADEETKVQPEVKNLAGLSMKPDDLGKRLREATGKFKIPPPATRGEVTPKADADVPAEKSTRPNLAETVQVKAIKNPAFEDFFDDLQVEDGRNVTPLRGVPAVGMDDSENEVDATPRDHTPTGHFASALGFDEAAGAESDIEFDLGLSTPVSHTPMPMTKKEPQKAGREPQPTPRAGTLSREPIKEDEFFALAESFAAESSGAEERPYRGEPIPKGSASKTREVDGNAANPFKESQPTGVNHGPVEASFVLEEMSQAASGSASSSVVAGNTTNLTAIMLEARRMYERGEFEPALDVCVKILSRGPNSEAEELKTAISGEIERGCVEKLGSLAKVPTLNTSVDLSSVNLDHRAGFLMSQVDGMMSLEDILELSSMPRTEALRLLVFLVENGVVDI